MQIRQVEELTGISKKNIRFYEDQGLIRPNRDPANGYREYKEEEVMVLRQIKLFRKLQIPIEEIRKIQTKTLSIPDCLNRHLIYLSHEKRNLEVYQEICQQMITDSQNQAFDTDRYLLNIVEMEEKGIRFMNPQKTDIKKKSIVPIVTTLFCILVFLALIVFYLWAQGQEPLPLGVISAIICLPLMAIVGIIIALRERLDEIKGGEEDEASKY